MQGATHWPDNAQVEYIQSVLDGGFLWIIGWRPDESRAVAAASL